MYIFTSVYVRHFEYFVYDFANSSIICQYKFNWLYFIILKFIIYSSKEHWTISQWNIAIWTTFHNTN